MQRGILCLHSVSEADATTDFGIPTSVIEPHIEAHVVYAVHMMGCFSVADMVNKVFEMEFKLPIEFQTGSDPIH
jgi:hypothetical protein